MSEPQEDAPREQQWRIFEAAHLALGVLNTLPHEERLGAIATMLALEIGYALGDVGEDNHALVYVGKTVSTLLPEVKRQAAAEAKAAGH